MCNRLVPFVLFFTLLSIPLSVMAIGEDDATVPGQVALVGMDYNIYTFDFETDTLNPISSDASISRRYQWPTWSSDGRLAYFCCDLRVTQNLDSGAFLSSDGTVPGEQVYEGQGENIIYAAWSPANCSDGTSCRELAMLVSDVRAGGLSVEMVKNTSTENTSRTIERGSPFYYRWNASGTQLIFHRNNQRIDIYDIAENDVTFEYENASSGTFQTPEWSPVDNRILFGVENEAGTATNLVILEDEEATVLVDSLPGFISFLWSPDGQYIAYRTLRSDSIDEVVIVEADTGTEVTRTIVDGVLSFFWSPDSHKLAYITAINRRANSAMLDVHAKPAPARAQEEVPSFIWSVLDIDTGENTRFPYEFIPPYEMQYLLAYFDQFATSHQLWSPDSRYLVFSEIVDIDTVPRGIVSVLDTEIPSIEPAELSDGVFAVWSFE